jgi:heme a synthase
MTTPAYDFTPGPAVMLIGLALALLPLLWVAWRHRLSEPTERRRALAWVVLFLTFDLVLFGAFTRLTDSGLGCPDWPGCYGSTTPLGAHGDIGAAQTAMPTGPVTHGKAWIEMIHRYLATGVGGLITVMMLTAWFDTYRQRQAAATRAATAAQGGVSPWWPTATFVWVCMQGAFGALTVTMKLYPAIVTLHLLGGLGLLALLAVQGQVYNRRTLSMTRAMYAGVLAVFVLSIVQITLGGWVSTNYAVLACQDFPTCQGSWWPVMDFDAGFTIARELGAGKNGGYLPFAALTAIHWVHRLGAAVLASAMVLLVWRLLATGRPDLRVWAGRLAAVIGWQVLSGLSNVVLGWPLVAAVAHTGGAAALVVVLTMLLVRAQRAPVQASAAPAVRRTEAGLAS